MSTINAAAVAVRLTPDRLSSYLRAADHDLERAIALYNWNIAIGGALHEDIGRLEVLFRNALDAALVAHGVAQRWPSVWYRRQLLFPGRHGGRALADIAKAQSRAASTHHGKVIAELTLGFWRYLCAPHYLTSLWVPALAGAFPRHPDAGDPRAVRADVEDRIQRVHFLRNRIAHHEPIHQRDLERDHRSVLDVAGWICADTRAWVGATSRSLTVLGRRP
jgi:hypothetical protein